MSVFFSFEYNRQDSLINQDSISTRRRSLTATVNQLHGKFNTTIIRLKRRIRNDRVNQFIPQEEIIHKFNQAFIPLRNRSSNCTTQRRWDVDKRNKPSNIIHCGGAAARLSRQLWKTETLSRTHKKIIRQDYKKKARGSWCWRAVSSGTVREKGKYQSSA